jgi:hypothetical protein
LEGVALNQLINVAVAEKLSALRTDDYFSQRAARANLPKALKILQRAGAGKSCNVHGGMTARPSSRARIEAVRDPGAAIGPNRRLPRCSETVAIRVRAEVVGACPTRCMARCALTSNSRSLCSKASPTRQLSRSKTPDSLLVLCFGVLKTGKPFDPAIAMGC